MKTLIKITALFLTFICCPSKNFAISWEEDLTLTSSQKELLDEFKQKMEQRLPFDYMKKEIYLIKWLRSNDFDLKSAEEHLLKNLKWRKEQKMDTIQSEDWSDMKTDYRYFLDGRDKAGRPFLYLDLGNMDLRRTVVTGKGDRLLRYVDKGIDEACNLVRELGEKYGNVTRGHLLMNMGGFNVITHGCLRCVPILLRIVMSYQEHWPECVDKIIGVNSPAAVQPVLNNAILPMLNKGLQQSVVMYGTNKRSWMKEVEKEIGIEQLPPQIGGTSKAYKGMGEY